MQSGAHVGGNGNFRRVAEAALKIVKGWTAWMNAPNVYSPYCGNNNKMLSRRNAVRILQTVLNKEGALLRKIPRREKGKVYPLSSIGTYLSPTGPAYLSVGLISRFACLYSTTCATHPATLDMAKTGRFTSTGRPR